MPSTSTGLAVERAEAVLDRVDGEARHGLVDLAGQRREPQVGIAVEQEVRVDRDAVAADPDARLVDVAVRLRVGGADHLGDVDPAARREAGELVGVGDVHVAVRRLRQLRHLGGLGVGHCPDLGPLVEDGPVELDRATRALRARAADDLRVALEVEEDATDEDALRAEGEEEVPVQLEAAALGQHRSEPIAGRADRQRRLVDRRARPSRRWRAMSRVAASIGPKSISRSSSTTTGTMTTTASA